MIKRAKTRESARYKNGPRTEIPVGGRLDWIQARISNHVYQQLVINHSSRLVDVDGNEA